LFKRVVSWDNSGVGFCVEESIKRNGSIVYKGVGVNFPDCCVDGSAAGIEAGARFLNRQVSQVRYRGEVQGLRHPVQIGTVTVDIGKDNSKLWVESKVQL
jgi:hypothetical protein